VENLSHKEMFNVLMAKIAAKLASYLSHILYTPHEQEQRRQ
jgi:hypothetical protein